MVRPSDGHLAEGRTRSHRRIDFQDRPPVSVMPVGWRGCASIHVNTGDREKVPTQNSGTGDIGPPTMAAMGTGTQSSRPEKRIRFEATALPFMGALYATALRLSRRPEDASDIVQD